MVEENEILKKLVIEEKDITKELESLVGKSLQFFKIEKPGGKIVFVDFGSLSDPQRICALLLGKYFATKLGIIEKSELGISEISNELGRPMTTLSSPMRELVKKGFVEKLPIRKYRIAYHRISKIFDEILRLKKEANQKI